MKNKILIGIVILAIIGLVAFFLSSKLSKDENIACTADAMLCPDGSSVGRMPPSCEFTPCPTLAQ